MNSNDKIIGAIILDFLVLTIMFCLGWWSTYLLKLNIYYGIISGLVLGTIINIVFTAKIIENLFKIDYIIPAIAYLLYSFLILGFFMGVPLFNIFLAVILGWYIGRRMKVNDKNKEQFNLVLKNSNIFGLTTLFVICCISAVIALNDSYTGDNIQHMLKLGFEVTDTIIWSIILIGGSLLLVIQYWLTKTVAILIYKGK